MSQSAREESKQARHLCVSCHARKARFRYRGVVKADRDHTLCFECFRAERDRLRAYLLASVRPKPLRVTLAGATSPLDSNCHDMTSATLTAPMSTISATSANILDSTHCRVGRSAV